MTLLAEPSPLTIRERPIDGLLAEAVGFHGHLCPGQVLGVDARTGRGVRVAARDDARALAPLLVPGEPDARRAQIAAYRVMPEPSLLLVESVVVAPGWLGRPRVRVRCAERREGVSYGREVRVGGRALCRGCAGERYYGYEHGHIASPPTRP